MVDSVHTRFWLASFYPHAIHIIQVRAATITLCRVSSSAGSLRVLKTSLSKSVFCNSYEGIAIMSLII